MKTLQPEKYRILFIAPLKVEKAAIIHMFDQKHDGRFPNIPGHQYVYTAGTMAGHNVVIASLPEGGVYGNGAAAALAGQAAIFFPRLDAALLVGIAGGVPTPDRDIRLGDVLVAMPEGDHPGLIDLDLGKETMDGFELLHGGRTNATQKIVRSTMGDIRTDYMYFQKKLLFLTHYEDKMSDEMFQGIFADPGEAEDHLYNADNSEVTRKTRLPGSRTCVWYGPIGSGSKLIKNVLKREELSKKHDIIGIEMEGAGVLNTIPVGVIRGVCDYADGYKNDVWQPYAAAMAAAYAKEILSRIGPERVTERGAF